MLVKYNVKNENLSLYIFINMSSEMIGYEVEEEDCYNYNESKGK